MSVKRKSHLDKSGNALIFERVGLLIGCPIFGKYMMRYNAPNLEVVTERTFSLNKMSLILIALDG
ncbi:MAG: hypothetical protein FWD90_06785 [Defluviitaleaceae bacterium]|nr:hypothetical protein [Defluviitaleaceae bacterium]